MSIPFLTLSPPRPFYFTLEPDAQESASCLASHADITHITGSTKAERSTFPNSWALPPSNPQCHSQRRRR